MMSDAFMGPVAVHAHMVEDVLESVELLKGDIFVVLV